MSSCWPVVIRKSSFTSSLHTHTLPLPRTPPTESPLCAPHNSKSVLGQSWPKRKPLLLEKKKKKNERLIGITGQLGARAEPACSQVGGAAGPGWPSAMDGNGQRRKYSGQRQLRLGSRAPLFSEGLLPCVQLQQVASSLPRLSCVSKMSQTSKHG